MLPIVLLLAACTPNVISQYEKARSEALLVASEHPPDWQPDAALAIATSSLEAAVDDALDLALGADANAIQVKLPLGLVGRVRPHLQATTVRLRPSDSCAGCFGFDAALAGKVGWSIGPAEGHIPVDVTVAGVLGIDIGEARRILLTPRKLGAMKLTTPKGEKVEIDLDGPVQDWIRAAFNDRMPTIEVGEIDADGLPVQELRLKTQPAGFILELLSDVPKPVPLPTITPPKEGVTLTLSESTLVALARRAAFEAGTLSMDVAADPQTLTVDGNRFTLGLRLWRLTGAGWWRDYSVTGTLGVDGKRIRLVATDAQETGQSRGATLVDPLAALFEGKILEAVVDNLHQSLPAQKKAAVDTIGLSARVWKVEGVADTLVVAGELEVVPPASR